jgi:hypothetical protein
MNPTVDERIITDSYEADEVVAGAEYGAEFRGDVESLVAREAVAACVVAGRLELAPVPGVRFYDFVDLAGGGPDSMTFAIAHRTIAYSGAS